MARVNITVPDDVIRRARAEGLNVSRVAAEALEEELDRRARIVALDAYLHELEGALGPVSDDDANAAREWADHAFGEVATPSDAARRRAS